jgi:hypothetical protein
VAVIGLVGRFHAPQVALGRTRDERPAGYGVEEHCLPFTAAAAAGILIPSPISWGTCPREEAPPGARVFPSPVRDGRTGEGRAFYVVDDPVFAFQGNQFTVPTDTAVRIGNAPIPGLSFFDRPDQQHLVKLHLPYGWRTAEGIALLFTQPVNRGRGDSLRIISGLVETSWYVNPVTLIIQLPPPPSRIHVAAGEVIAQAIPLDTQLFPMRVEIAESHRRETRDAMAGIKQWRQARQRDRSAYKQLARSHHGRLEDDASDQT